MTFLASIALQLKLRLTDKKHPIPGKTSGPEGSRSGVVGTQSAPEDLCSRSGVPGGRKGKHIETTT